VNGDEAAPGQRRFAEELAQIPVLEHPVYGRCLAPAYPSQLFIALGQLADLPIGAWRGQASIDWGIDPSLVRRFRQYQQTAPGAVLDEAHIRFAERALAERARAAGLGDSLGELDLPAQAAGRLLWWQPRNLSPRIAAQQAAFVFGPVADEPWESIRLGRGQVSPGGTGAVPGTALIYVSAQLKATMNGIWERLLGFSEESLFPDFDGFALAHSIGKPFPPDFAVAGTSV
jgi:hypothetical protein